MQLLAIEITFRITFRTCNSSL